MLELTVDIYAAVRHSLSSPLNVYEYSIFISDLLREAESSVQAFKVPLCILHCVRKIGIKIAEPQSAVSSPWGSFPKSSVDKFT
jgi:hypothetical protein